MENNTERLKNSLKALQEVFKGLEDYRVLGSVLVAALNGLPHRELHDIDLLIDKRIYRVVEARFKELGFRKVTKHALVFEWDEYEKTEHLSFGFLLKGNFKQDYFEYKPSNLFGLRIDNTYLKPTEYELYGYKIRGIPLRSVYEGIKVASLNTKRKVDLNIVLQKIKGELPTGLSLDQAFNVRVFGIAIPYLYPAFSQVYNIVGGIRLSLGKSYDTWH